MPANIPEQLLTLTKMEALLEASVWGANIIPTALLIFLLLYWLTVIVGFTDLDMWSIDLDIDMDTSSASVGWLNHVLYFFNLGQVPVMLFLSFLILPMWFIAIVTTELLTFDIKLLSYIYLLPNFVISLFIAKVCTQPFVKLFSKLEDQVDDNIEVIGRICTVILGATEDKMGQARIDERGSVLLLNIKARKGTSINKGETALVIDYLADKSYYIIEPYDAISAITI